ncbi:MAG: hypothetical protein ACRDL0_03680 [Thermoleophilaceae bacterium]
MTANSRARPDGAVAREAARYLKVVELFATLGADPHAAARARAAHARAHEDRVEEPRAAATKRRGVLGWRT